MKNWKRQLYLLEVTPKKTIPPIINDVEVEDCKSPDNLGFPEGNLFGGDTEASKKIRQPAAINKDMKQRFLQQEENDNSG